MTTQADRAAEQLVEIRRVVWLPTAVGAGAALMAVLFLMRVFQGQWQSVLVAVPMTALTIVCVFSIWDGRLPLLVADAHGIRLRDGETWRGLPWSVVHRVEVRASHSLVADGAIVVSAIGLEEARVPLGLVTGIAPAHQAALAGRLAALAAGRAPIARPSDPETQSGRQPAQQPARSRGVPSLRPVPTQRIVARVRTAAGQLVSVPGQRGPAVGPAAGFASAAGATPVVGALALAPQPEPTAALPEVEQLRRPEFGGELDEPEGRGDREGETYPLVLKASKGTTRVQVRGSEANVLFERTMTSGEVVELSAPRRVVISVDSGGILDVEFDREDFGLLGDEGPATQEYAAHD